MLRPSPRSLLLGIALTAVACGGANPSIFTTADDGGSSGGQRRKWGNRRFGARVPGWGERLERGATGSDCQPRGHALCTSCPKRTISTASDPPAKAFTLKIGPLGCSAAGQTPNSMRRSRATRPRGSIYASADNSAGAVFQVPARKHASCKPTNIALQQGWTGGSEWGSPPTPRVAPRRRSLRHRDRERRHHDPPVSDSRVSTPARSGSASQGARQPEPHGGRGGAPSRGRSAARSPARTPS